MAFEMKELILNPNDFDIDFASDTEYPVLKKSTMERIATILGSKFRVQKYENIRLRKGSSDTSSFIRNEAYGITCDEWGEAFLMFSATNRNVQGTYANYICGHLCKGDTYVLAGTITPHTGNPAQYPLRFSIFKNGTIIIDGYRLSDHASWVAQFIIYKNENDKWNAVVDMYTDSSYHSLQFMHLYGSDARKYESQIPYCGYGGDIYSLVPIVITRDTDGSIIYEQIPNIYRCVLFPNKNELKLVYNNRMYQTIARNSQYVLYAVDITDEEE